MVFLYAGVPAGKKRVLACILVLGRPAREKV